MINYEILAEATRYYELRGYKRIEAPWLVTQAISDITKPEGCSTYLVRKDKEEKQKAFVASGEQSFLYLINKGFLPDGKYQTITPCLRNDPFDQTHTKYFMKLELIEFSTSEYLGDKGMAEIIKDAMDFFKLRVSVDDELATKWTPQGYDIELNGVEIGSYGHRECDFCNWIYGTGVAEPRFSRLVERRFINGIP